MNVLAIPCLTDNYAYLLVQDGHAVVVDPSEAAPVLAALGDLTLDAIWCTHHHWDHVGGVEELLARFPVPVIGSRYDRDQKRIPGQTVAVGTGDTVAFAGQLARVYDIPGHTLGAIAFELPTPGGGGHLFTGDTLFAGGCGRVFEGTMPQMRASLATLRGLDPALRVWCGHEYTVKNLEFAQAIAPEPGVAERLAAMVAVRAKGEPTVGRPLADERATNPFVRWDAPSVQVAATGLGADPADADAVYSAIRLAKDRW